MNLLRLAVLALALVALAPSGLAAISVWQNDGGTGGDAANDALKADPLSNRHGGQDGSYFGEMYRNIEESDWYYVTVPAVGNVENLDITFTTQANPNTPCLFLTTTRDTTFVAQLLAPNMTVMDQSSGANLCYGTGTLHMTHPDVPGRWRIGFLLTHDGATAGAASTVLHEQYVFDVRCGC